jgi:hypothetical protein
MSATLQLTRSFRVADGALPFKIVLDGRTVGKIANRNSTEIPIEAGTHTLQLSYHLGLTSPDVTFDVSDGETALFVCHAPHFVLVIPRLAASLFRREGWIALKRA